MYSTSKQQQTAKYTYYSTQRSTKRPPRPRPKKKKNKNKAFTYCADKGKLIITIIINEFDLLHLLQYIEKQ